MGESLHRMLKSQVNQLLYLEENLATVMLEAILPTGATQVKGLQPGHLMTSLESPTSQCSGDLDFCLSLLADKKHLGIGGSAM